MTDEEKKEEAKRRAIILMTLKGDSKKLRNGKSFKYAEI